MNRKRIAVRLVSVSMLLMILAVTIVSAQVYKWHWPGKGPKVDEHWWSIIVSDDERLEAALTCDIDILGVPNPEALATLVAAGFTIDSTTELGYTFLLENNRVWPFGNPDGSGNPEPMSTHFRKAVNRLTPKDDCVALYAPLMGKAEWWLPPGQAYWINPATPVPTFDPVAAIQHLNDGGFVKGEHDNPYYDPAYPWSSDKIRIDPLTGDDICFEYYTIGPIESPIGFEMAQLITEYLRKAGLCVDLVAGTWLGLVFILVNEVLEDYQLATGLGIIWGSPSPDILYDFTYSENLPLWNFVYMNISAIDCEAMRMMSTLDLAECRQATYNIQTILAQYEPYYPMLLWKNYVAEKGPSRESYPSGAITWDCDDPHAEGTHPGVIGLVNYKGKGVPAGDNVFGKMLTRALRYDPTRVKYNPYYDEDTPYVEINKWGYGAYLDTLNPTTADTAADWQVLANIEEGFWSYNPYTLDYMWWGAEGKPTIEEWIGPGRTSIGLNGVYDNAYNGTHYACVGENEIPETPQPVPYVECFDIVPGGDDYVLPIGEGPYTCECGTFGPYDEPYVDETCLAGDDQLGMVTTWQIREEMYWHDSDPGPDGIFGTADDGVLYPVNSSDLCFGLNLLRDQANVRYFSTWYFIHACEAVDAYTVKIQEERRYLFAFEGHGVGFITPKHIWEPFIDPTIDEDAIECILPCGELSHGDRITDWVRHHEEWFGWEEPYMQDPQYRDWQDHDDDDDTGEVDPLAPWLTYLIGFGPFKYHIDGWIPGESAHFEANRQYFAHQICIGDIDFNQKCELPDLYSVMASFGKYGDSNYRKECDVCYPAQVVDLDEIFAVRVVHFGHWWGPQNALPSGFVLCNCLDCPTYCPYWGHPNTGQ